jgi:hypothetical protein
MLLGAMHLNGLWLVELVFRLKRTEEAAKFPLFSGFFGSSKLSKVLNNISQNWGFVKACD